MEKTKGKINVKQGGEGVLVWQCISSIGPGNLGSIDSIMDKMVYLNIEK